MSLEEIREKFIPVWKQIKDFVPMGSKEEGERFKRKGLRLEQDSAKKVKTSEEVSKEDLKTMMQLVPVEEVYVEALQVKHPIIDWEVHTEGQRTYWKIIRLGGNTTATSDKEKELWVKLKRLYEPDVEDQLWTQTQALMHDPVEWRLYDTCGVHHVLSRDQEIFIKTKKNQLKQQYGNFKEDGKETLEQTFNRLQAIIKYEDINQIDEDDTEEIDIKWNMALLSMRADRYWKKTWKKISIQGTNVAGFDKSKVECFNYHKIGHFDRKCRAPRSQDRGRRENYRQGSKEEKLVPKALMAIDGVGWDWSYMENEEENHALVADEEAPIEFSLMAKSSSDTE
nr:hypothetical protein [Tanacetum cinerariifolium]